MRTWCGEQHRGVNLKRRKQTDNSSSNLGYPCEGQQGDGANCKRTVLSQTVISSERSMAQTVTCDCNTVDWGETGCIKAFNWSRDQLVSEVLLQMDLTNRCIFAVLIRLS